ncbi:PQQ-dependent sugar dehydrogenase [Microbacterium aurantiacum]|uniref:PQQ-dependent sugar dehydrogenase n=1 Tax=Microbacterium aurantiacum TaxID=162393 RepID=A0AAJ2LZ17_9MICO|nr:PQQ-dependent sugar dehydrogenase [Microbacterium aurantiacum]MDS0244884.1 PQQ-dependent sugar dehydrogenase [Microbacterium aurantiacum]
MVAGRSSSSRRDARRRLGGALAVLVAGALVLAGCAGGTAETDAALTVSASVSPSSTPLPTGQSAARAVVPQGEPMTVAADLVAPWSVAVVGETVLVSERDTGDIREIVGDTTRVVGTVPGVVFGGEGGLLGIAADGDDGLFVSATGPDGNRVQRFDVSGAPGSLALGDAETLLDGIPSARTHNGGRIAIGPDGMLYVTTGDANVPDLAQDRDSLAGKILRMTPEGAVPADNPFPDSFVYSLGHRNPQGIAWAEDGTLFASEFGQNTWDELNIITPGANYGWPVVEGQGGGADFVDPVQQWSTAEASPSGIAVIEGTVFIANLRGERVRAVPVADPSTATEYYVGELGRIRDVVAAPDGDLWILTGNTDGRGAGPRDGDDRLLTVAVG